MMKIDALKNCVWLENFVRDNSHGKAYYEAIGKLMELQKYISELPDDEQEAIL